MGTLRRFRHDELCLLSTLVVLCVLLIAVPGEIQRPRHWVSFPAEPILALVAGVGLGRVFLSFRRGEDQAVLRRLSVRAFLYAVWAWARDWWSLLGLLCIYPLVPVAQALTGFADRDALLGAWDRRLFFGSDPLDGLAALTARPLTEWMAFCYTGYGFLFMIVIGLLYLRRDLRPFRFASFAICMCLALGYAGYLLVPAQGPLAGREFPAELSGFFLEPLKAALMDRPRIERDVFPSLHTATTLVLAWLAWKFARPIFWLSLPMVVTMPFACVYLRYHYAVDVVAGLMLAAIVIGVSGKNLISTLEKGFKNNVI